jgi:hypothetical protein
MHGRKGGCFFFFFYSKFPEMQREREREREREGEGLRVTNLPRFPPPSSLLPLAGCSFVRACGFSGE